MALGPRGCDGLSVRFRELLDGFSLCLCSCSHQSSHRTLCSDDGTDVMPWRTQRTKRGKTHAHRQQGRRVIFAGVAPSDQRALPSRKLGGPAGCRVL